MFRLNKNSKIISKISLILATFCLVFISSFGFFAKPVKAVGISVMDIPRMGTDALAQAWATFSWNMDWFLKYAQEELFNTVLSVALNTIAYDAATYIGSGGEGGKAFWRKENLGDYIKNIGDNAAGIFIENFAKVTWGEEWDICEPDIDFKFRIGVGLVNQERPKPDCSFTEMKKNWENELKSENFLTDFSNVFYTNDNPQYKVIKIINELNKKKIAEETIKIAEDAVNDSWKTTSDPSKENKQPPGSFADTLFGALDMSRLQITKPPGEQPLVDAAHIFVNQLAYTLFQRLVGNLGNSIPYSSSPYSGNYGGLKDYESDPGGVSPNRENVKRKTMQIMSPDFSVKGDYSILTELTMCPDPKNAETNHCVIGDSFRQAIQEKMTVIEAMEGGYINGDGLFGYKADGLEPDYKEAFPHRSILILKKYRIVPVGWDLAAQYIKDDIKDELNGNSVSLKNLVGCYDSDDKWETSLSATDWCKGLIDPRWVLKAPINFCKREGYGPNFLTEDVYNKDENSEIKVSRKKYCADEQTCIQETDDGKCEYYGYCIEDYRKWNFKAESCDPTFNTCQTFKSSQGKKISYLKNTLDYGACNANSAGCAKFASEPTLNNIASGTVDWFSAASSIYFNRNVKECSEDKEGCHQFIRMGDKTGSNFIYDSSFEEGNTLFGGSIVEGEGYVGLNALQVSGNHSENIEVGPGSYQVGGQIYSLSFFAKCSGGGEFSINGQASSTEIYGADSWNRYGTTYGFPLSIGVNTVGITLNTSGACLIDGIKLEKGREISNYSDYGEDNTIYQKLLPEYLEDDCYVSPGSDNSFDPNADPKCFKYGRKCNVDEVGCKLYDEEGSDFSIPAKVTAQNYCPEECVGFDTYVQDETYFADRETEYLIPNIGIGCSAEFAGCDEFTNLDVLEEGGEVREYYVELRQCISDTSSDCAPFYTWQTDKNEGQQLVSHILQDADNNGEPDYYGVGSCSLAEMDPSNPNFYNPDCREFYSKDGDISYVLFTHTISCSADCHAYRRTKKNIISGACPGSATSCGVDSVTSDLIYCKNNGEWSTEHNACIYHGIPGQGKTCLVNNSGCREYNGNQGNNERIVLVDSFESGVEDWTGGVVSPTSLRTDEQSFYVNVGPADKTVGTYVKKGNSYVIEFLARASAGSTNLTISLRNSPTSSVFTSFTTNPSINNEWNFYRINLEDLDHTPTSTEILRISSGAGAFYIDNIRLIEITDRYYLIEDSWQTPDSCNKDIYGTPALHYMLGCSTYQDGDGDTNYLHEFTNLCQESAVGCEIMIDKHNYEERIGFSSATTPSITVPADSFDYIAFNKENKCNVGVLGCERFGKNFEYAGTNVYHNIYLNNNPNKYKEILCSDSEVGCEVWNTNDGEEYFRDPEDEICLWQQEEGKTDNGGWGWYRKQVNRCDVDSDGTTTVLDQFCVDNIDCLVTIGTTSCVSDIDCGINNNCIDGSCYYSCILENSINPCPTDIILSGVPKTLGEGGLEGYVEQPAGYLDGDIWVGVCPASESGCTEYIDPQTAFNPNLFDARYTIPEAQLEPYSLYYDPNNTISPTVSEVININGNPNLVYIYSSSTIPTDFIVVGASGDILRELVVDYQIKSKLNSGNCNGIYSPDEGCVLFYERDYNRDGYSGFKFNSIESALPDNLFEAPVISSPPLDSNKLLKVSPDRDCDTWLACDTYIKQKDNSNECFDIGVCASLGENGNCDYFVTNTAVGTGKNNNLVAPGSSEPIALLKSDIHNLTGYSMVGYNSNNSYFKVPYDLYNLGYMPQVGQKANVTNGSFEMYNKNTKYPYSWRSVNNEEFWNSNMFSVIDNPIDAQKENIEHPFFGKSFLRFSPAAGMAQSDFIEVEPNEIYVLSFWVNTQNMQSSGGFDSMFAGVGVKTYNEEGVPSYPSATVGGHQGLDFDPNCNDCDYSPQPTFNGLDNKVRNGENWTKKVVKFKLGNNTRRIKLFTLGILHWGDVVWCDSNGNGTIDINSGDSKCMNTVDCGETRTSLPDKCEAYWDGHTNGFGNYDENEAWYDDPTIKACNRSGSPAKAIKTISSCGGTAYFDNIQLSPALEIKAYNDDTKWEQPQSCRLYPREDSLSCEYFGDSGKKYKGQKGYCLQYDRAPGNPNACLLWWPVDRIRGAAIKEGGDYNSTFPLYYCIDTTSITIPISTDIKMAEFGGKIHKYTSGIVEFNNDIIKDKYRHMFRYPYVQSLFFKTINSEKDFPMPEIIMGRDYFEVVRDHKNKIRYKDGRSIESQGGFIYELQEKDDRWGGFMAGGYNGSYGGSYYASFFSYLNDANGRGQATANIQPWHDMSPYSDGVYFAVKIVTDEDSKYSGLFSNDPRPDLRGDILGLHYQLNDTSHSGGFAYAKIDSDVKFIYCDKLVRTVTSIGANKYWSDKVFKGSVYTVSGVQEYNSNSDLWRDVGFNSFSTPFGAILADNPQEDPSMWVETDIGYEPLYYSPFTYKEGGYDNEYYNLNASAYPSAGNPYNLLPTGSGLINLGEDRAKNILKSLFAQSYGFWEWKERWLCTDGSTPGMGGVVNTPYPYKEECSDCDGEECTWQTVSKDVTDLVCSFGGTICSSTAEKSDPCKGGLGNCQVQINTITIADFMCPKPDDEIILCYPSYFCGSGTKCSSESRYHYIEGDGWIPPIQPVDSCPASGRPTTSPEDQCGIAPSIDNFKVNGSAVSTSIRNAAGFVNLTFNSHINSQQLPLTMYQIYWGDEEYSGDIGLSETGIKMMHKPNANDPHSFYHLYSYWDLRMKSLTNGDIDCSDPNYCVVTPGIRIKDNWNWYYPSSSSWELGPTVKVYK